MIKLIWQRLALFRRADFLSARDLLQRAGAISGLFLLVQLAGFREFTSVLNGTIGSLALGWKLSAFLAIIYIAFYLAFVILVPVLVLAAMILMIGRQCIQKAENPRIIPDANPQKTDHAT
jgi:hypothetical protein